MEVLKHPDLVLKSCLLQKRRISCLPALSLYPNLHSPDPSHLSSHHKTLQELPRHIIIAKMTLKPSILKNSPWLSPQPFMSLSMLQTLLELPMKPLSLKSCPCPLLSYPYKPIPIVLAETSYPQQKLPFEWEPLTILARRNGRTSCRCNCH